MATSELTVMGAEEEEEEEDVSAPQKQLDNTMTTEIPGRWMESSIEFSVVEQ